MRRNEINKAQEKRIAKGDLLYKNFVDKISEISGVSLVSTPKTNTLEIFALIRDEEYLFLEMCKEYLSNFVEDSFTVENGVLYKIKKIKQRV